MQKIKVENVIKANIQKVWDYYTNPIHIVGWAYASDDWECPHAENDLRVGGRFLNRMSAKDKSFGFDFTGTYIEVENLKKIVYQMDKEEGADVNRICETNFEELEDGMTKIMVEFDSEDHNPIEMQKAGWQAILDNFKKLVESA